MMPPTETAAVDLTGIAVSLGRIEEKVSHLGGMEERLRNVETAIAEINAKDRPRVPWYLVVGGLAGAAAAVGFVLDMLAKLIH